MRSANVSKLSRALFSWGFCFEGGRADTSSPVLLQRRHGRFFWSPQGCAGRDCAWRGSKIRRQASTRNVSKQCFSHSRNLRLCLMVCMASQHPKKKMSANNCSHTFRFTCCRPRQNRTLAQQWKWRAKVSSLVTSYLEVCKQIRSSMKIRFAPL